MRQARHRSRRQLLRAAGGGLGWIALAHMMGRETPAAAAHPHGGLHHRAKAKRVVQLFMSGAASQCDTFDYKPLLIERNGRDFDPGGKVELFQSSPGPVMRSPWSWKQHGESGKWMSSLVPRLAECADTMAFFPAMVSESNVHGPATFLQNSGFALPGFPSMGAWISYGLGSLSDDLPTFVVLPDARGFAPNGPGNHSAGFLPAQHQGTMIRAGRSNPIHDLFPPDSAEFITPGSEAAGLRLLAAMNRDHMRGREDDSRLEARIRAYEMAARLQVTAPRVLDLAGESGATRKLYGIDEPVTADFGLRCLVARRLLERGVRFVQVWSGADNGFPRRNWDSHEDLAKDHGGMGKSMDRPAAALIRDLEARGLLEDTRRLLDHRVRAHAVQPGRPRAATTTRSRSRPGWRAGGRAGRDGLRLQRRVVRTGPWSTRRPATTCTPPSCTCWASTTRASRSGTTAIDRRLTDVHGRVIREVLA